MLPESCIYDIPRPVGEGTHAGGGRMLGTAAATHKAEPGTGSSGGYRVRGGVERGVGMFQVRFWDDGVLEGRRRKTQKEKRDEKKEKKEDPTHRIPHVARAPSGTTSLK